MKKILAIVLAVVMLLPVFAVNAFAADATELGLFFGDFDNGFGKRTSVKVSESGVYTLKSTVSADTEYYWVLVKSTADDCVTNFPEGTVIKLNYIKVDGVEVPCMNSQFANYTVKADTKVELQYIFDLDYNFSSKGTVTESVEVQIEVVLPAAEDEATTTVEVETPIELNAKNVSAANGSVAFEDGTVDATGADLVLIKLPKALAADDTITVHFTGTTESSYRYWVSNGAWTSASTIVVVDETGDIDKTVTITATGAADSLQIKGVNGAPLTIKLTSVALVEEKEVSATVKNMPVYEAPATAEEPIVVNGWTTNTGIDVAKVVDALKKDNSKIVMDLKMTGWGHLNFFLTSGTATMDLGWMVTGEKVFKGEEILAKIVAEGGESFDDITGIGFNGSDDTLVKSFVVYGDVLVPADDAANGKGKANGALSAYIYINDDYHGMFVGGYLLCAPHTDNGSGFCPTCHATILTAEDGEEGNKAYLSVTKAAGMDSTAELADGIVMADTAGDTEGFFRISSSWVDQNLLNKIVDACQVENAWLKITYTGEIGGLDFEGEASGHELTTQMTIAEDGEFKNAWINCADIVANAPKAMAKEFGGWHNVIIPFTEGAVLYGFDFYILDSDSFEIVDPTEPTDVDEVPEEPDTTEIPDEPATAEPDDSRDPMDRNPVTGITLAVLPMIIAAAAVVASKKN